MGTKELANQFHLCEASISLICKGLSKPASNSKGEFKKKLSEYRMYSIEHQTEVVIEPERSTPIVHSPVTRYHISELPEEEQQRIMSLTDKNRQTSKPNVFQAGRKKEVPGA